MNEIYKEIANVFHSFENMSPQESVNSHLEIKKQFLNFQLQKLVQLHSSLKESLKELEDVDKEWKILSKEFSKEVKLMEEQLNREKSSLLKEFKSGINDFLENVKMKTADDSKADAMAKVTFIKTENSRCFPCFNDSKEIYLFSSLNLL